MYLIVPQNLEQQAQCNFVKIRISQKQLQQIKLKRKVIPLNSNQDTSQTLTIRSLQVCELEDQQQNQGKVIKKNVKSKTQGKQQKGLDLRSQFEQQNYISYLQSPRNIEMQRQLVYSQKCKKKQKKQPDQRDQLDLQTDKSTQDCDVDFDKNSTRYESYSTKSSEKIRRMSSYQNINKEDLERKQVSSLNTKQDKSQKSIFLKSIEQRKNHNYLSLQKLKVSPKHLQDLKTLDQQIENELKNFDQLDQQFKSFTSNDVFNRFGRRQVQNAEMKQRVQLQSNQVQQADRDLIKIQNNFTLYSNSQNPIITEVKNSDIDIQESYNQQMQQPLNQNFQFQQYNKISAQLIKNILDKVKKQTNSKTQFFNFQYLEILF